jgi:hypothetical protein
MLGSQQRVSAVKRGEILKVFTSTVCVWLVVIACEFEVKKCNAACSLLD